MAGVTPAAFGREVRFWHSDVGSIAGGMTDMVVGSGVLFGETQRWKIPKMKCVFFTVDYSGLLPFCRDLISVANSRDREARLFRAIRKPIR